MRVVYAKQAYLHRWYFLLSCSYPCVEVADEQNWYVRSSVSIQTGQIFGLFERIKSSLWPVWSSSKVSSTDCPLGAYIEIVKKWKFYVLHGYNLGYTPRRNRFYACGALKMDSLFAPRIEKKYPKILKFFDFFVFSPELLTFSHSKSILNLPFQQLLLRKIISA